MRLERLELVNFRGFERFSLDLHPEFTLLLGTNGAGKTALVDAATIALRHLIPEAVGPHIEETDLRQVSVVKAGLPFLDRVQPAVISANGRIDEVEVHWRDRRTLAEHESRSPEQVRSWWKRAVSRAASGQDIELPVLGSFGARRDVRRDVAVSSGPGSPVDGWLQWWRPAMDFNRLVDWMRRQTYADLQQGTRLPQLAGVQAAVATCIHDVGDLFYDVRADELRVRLADGRVLPMAALSDGYRNVVALVADLAWRAATLNPQFGADAPRRSPGIVLIDEIDLHLHPSWQRRVIGDLRRTFPRFQFLATTHSPQVLSTAQPAWVRVLNGGREAVSVEHVHGRDSNSLLEDVFGVAERPEETKRRIDDLFHRIDQHDTNGAYRLLVELREEVGQDDADLVRARWMLDAEADDAGLSEGS